MLVLSRKNKEAVMVGGSDGFERMLKVTVLEIGSGKVRLGFEVDNSVPVHRWEVWERIQAGQETYFFWLQAVDEPSLAFVVTDPTLFFKDYQVPLREEVSQELQLADPSYLQTFVICNKVGDWLQRQRTQERLEP